MKNMSRYYPMYHRVMMITYVKVTWPQFCWAVENTIGWFTLDWQRRLAARSDPYITKHSIHFHSATRQIQPWTLGSEWLLNFELCMWWLQWTGVGFCCSCCCDAGIEGEGDSRKGCGWGNFSRPGARRVNFMRWSLKWSSEIMKILYKCFHMTPERFSHPLAHIGPSIKFQDTWFCDAILSDDRLAITLRYLVTGDSMQTLS